MLIDCRLLRLHQLGLQILATGICGYLSFVIFGNGYLTTSSASSTRSHAHHLCLLSISSTPRPLGDRWRRLMPYLQNPNRFLTRFVSQTECPRCISRSFHVERRWQTQTSSNSPENELYIGGSRRWMQNESLSGKFENRNSYTIAYRKFPQIRLEIVPL